MSLTPPNSAALLTSLTRISAIVPNDGNSSAVGAFVLTFIIAIIIHKTIGLRATEEQEFTGLDLSLHGERGYHLEEDVFAGATDTGEGHPDARGSAPALAR